MKAIIIIPSLNPDHMLLDLVKNLVYIGNEVVVVDDGSGKDYEDIFHELNRFEQCHVCTHLENRGKGAALKTGILYATHHFPQAPGVITADADGQHSIKDIRRISELLTYNEDQIILGVRAFKIGKIPLRSYLGNRITSLVYLASTGKKCPDTQTGLRAVPMKYAQNCLDIKGNRYEYEMNFLMEFARKKVDMTYLPIETIYIEDNKTSHFKPIMDSARIYLNIIKYSLSSILSAILDLLIFSLAVLLFFGEGSTGILLATIVARIFSGQFNFLMNKHWVFNSKGSYIHESKGYFLLFISQMLLSWLFVNQLQGLFANLTLVKILVDSTLFFASYYIQKRIIFVSDQKGRVI